MFVANLFGSFEVWMSAGFRLSIAPVQSPDGFSFKLQKLKIQKLKRQKNLQKLPTGLF